MLNKSEIVERLQRDKLVAVVRVDDTKQLYQVTEALIEGGVSLIEATMTIPGLLPVVPDYLQNYGEQIIFGIGSVLNEHMAEDAIRAGANFIVSPIMDTEILRKAQESNTLASVGAYSPTEIQQAYLAGSDIVKVFPADTLGPSFIKGVRAPMPHLKLMPTGGVTLENMVTWLDAGCAALGMGSALVDMKAVRAGDFAQITANAKALNEVLANWKNRT